MKTYVAIGYYDKSYEDFRNGIIIDFTKIKYINEFKSIKGFKCFNVDVIFGDNIIKDIPLISDDSENYRRYTELEYYDEDISNYPICKKFKCTNVPAIEINLKPEKYEGDIEKINIVLFIKYIDDEYKLNTEGIKWFHPETIGDKEITLNLVSPEQAEKIEYIASAD